MTDADSADVPALAAYAGPGNPLDALFPATRQRVLALLLGDPHRSFYPNEIIAAVAGGSGAVQRELSRLEDAGVLRSTRRGHRKLIEANVDSAFYPELAALVRKGRVLPDLLARGLAPVSTAVELALVHGEAARVCSGAVGPESGAVAPVEIDLLVVGEGLTAPMLESLLADAARALGQPVAVSVYTPAEFRARTSRPNTVLARILAGPHLRVLDRSLSVP